tara:strand:- start:7818 stop:9923 length:2106 start_codon:yes stop_codon:yes gene_type:complete
MGTYRNPSSVRKYQDSPSTVNNSAGYDYLAEQASQRKQDSIRAKENWDIKRNIQNISAGISADIGVMAGSEGFDYNGIAKGTEAMMDRFTKNKIRMETSSEEYEGYEEELKYNNAVLSFIKNAPDAFGALAYSRSEWDKSITKGFGNGPGQISARHTDPYFNLSQNYARPNSELKGTTYLENNYDKEAGQIKWSYVVEGEDVRKLNESKYKETGDEKYNTGNKHYISLTELNSFQENFNGDANNHGLFVTSANMSEVTAPDLVGAGVIENGMLKDKYMSIVDSQRGNTIINTTTPNIDMVQSALNASTQSFAQTLLNGTAQTLDATIRAYGEQGKGEDEDKVYYKPYARDPETNKYLKDENGFAYQTGEIEMPTLFDRSDLQGRSSTNGYIKEDYKKIINYFEDINMTENGGFSKGLIEVDKDATKALQQKIKDSKGKPLTPAQLEKQRSRDFINRSIDDVQKQITDGKNPLEAVKRLVNLGDDRITVNAIPNTGFIELNRTNENGTVIKTLIDPNTDVGRGLILRAYGHELPGELQDRIIEEPPNTKLDDYKNKFEKRKGLVEKQEAKEAVDERIVKAMTPLKSVNPGEDTRKQLLDAKDEYAKINIGIRKPEDDDDDTMLIIEDVTGGTHTLDVTDAKFKQKFEKILRITKESVEAEKRDNASKEYKRRLQSNEFLGIPNKNLVEVNPEENKNASRFNK